MEKPKLIISCLFQSQLFETMWAYYTQSSGNLYGKQCRQAAKAFLESYENLFSIDSKYRDPSKLNIGEKTDVMEIINNFKKWARGSELYPYNDLFKSKFMLFILLTELKSLFLKELDISPKYHVTLSSLELEYSTRYLRWTAHIPNAVLHRVNDLDKLILSASSSQSIAVVGDIRRSQDLMTYSKNTNDYSIRMEEFITTTRNLIDKHGGFFDKFTGDGFIAYFNEKICESAGSNYIESFINFIKDEIIFAIPFFENWERSIRRRPVVKIGLAIGADVGKIEFKDIKNHLIAVGDTIVWATRMASFSLGNEILANNLLNSLLIGRQDISLKEHRGKTKSGENFLAYKLNFL